MEMPYPKTAAYPPGGLPHRLKQVTISGKADLPEYRAKIASR